MSVQARAGDRIIAVRPKFYMLKWMLAKWIMQDIEPVLYWFNVDVDDVKAAHQELPVTFEEFLKWLKDTDVGENWLSSDLELRYGVTFENVYIEVRQFISYAAENDLDIETTGD